MRMRCSSSKEKELPSRVFISIGVACNVKYQIDKHIGNKETLFFDWLMTDMNSVISVLNCDNIHNILHPKNIVVDPFEPSVNNHHSRIVIKPLSFCVYIHDIGVNVTNKCILDFIEKYKRRFDRIINYIKTYNNGKGKLYFLRYGTITDYERQLFIQTILKINPQCNFYLMSIPPPTLSPPAHPIRRHPYFVEINTEEQQNTEGDDVWTTPNVNWKKIFNYSVTHL